MFWLLSKFKASKLNFRLFRVDPWIDSHNYWVPAHGANPANGANVSGSVKRSEPQSGDISVEKDGRKEQSSGGATHKLFIEEHYQKNVICLCVATMWLLDSCWAKCIWTKYDGLFWSVLYKIIIPHNFAGYYKFQNYFGQ